MVVWLIGMSSSGKTVLAEEMYKILNLYDKNWIFLDGDTVRLLFNEDLGHSIEDREKNGLRIRNLSKKLSEQDYNVLVCILSIFPNIQSDNRKDIKDYREIFIDVEMSNLIKRDNKNLYKNALSGKIKNVVGVDIEFPIPASPDIIFNNNKENIDMTEKAIEFISKLGIKLENSYEYSNLNRLETPHKYEYTPYIGSLFLKNYVYTREQAIKSLENKISKLKIINKVNDLEQCDSIFLEIGLISKSLSDNITLNLLTDILKSLIEDNLNEKQIGYIFKLQKRFEISKKIYSSYNEDLTKKSSDEYSCLLNYIIFSKILSEYIKKIDDRYEKVSLLNTLLKINDTVCSLKEDLILFSEISLAIDSIKTELEIYYDMKAGI